MVCSLYNGLTRTIEQCPSPSPNAGLVHIRAGSPPAARDAIELAPGASVTVSSLTVYTNTRVLIWYSCW